MSMVGKWGYSHDGEVFHGQFDSAEEAADEGAVEEGQTITVGQYRAPTKPEDCIWDIECLLQQIWDHEEYQGEWAEDAVSPNKEQKDSLLKYVSDLVGLWLDYHGLRPKFGVVEPESMREITVE